MRMMPFTMGPQAAPNPGLLRRPAGLFLACALAVTAAARTTRAGDAGADAGTGGTETTGSGGSGGADAGPPTVQPTATPDNLGCSASSTSSPSSTTALGFLLATLGVRARRRRRSQLLVSGALVALVSSSPARAADAPPPAPPPPASPPPAPSSPPSLYTTTPDSSATVEHGGRLRFGFGAGLTTDDYGAPFDVLGVSGFLELGGTENAGIWSPLVRLTGARAATTMQSATGTDGATFTWLTLALDGCPAQLTLTRGLWIRPCARVSGGLLTGSGTHAGEALTDHAPWVTFGLLARLQWRPVGPLFFEAQGGAAYAFTHDPLTVGTSMDALPVLTPASFEPFGSIGVGLTFP
jgi:MYXO-CTERM domain-containing protein